MSFIFSKKINRHEAPIGVLIFEAILFSLISGILLLFPRITDSFWLLLDLASQVTLIYYIILFLSAIRLRYLPPLADGFLIPGGKKCLWLLMLLGAFTSLCAFCIGFIPPETLAPHEVRLFHIIMSTGLMITILIPFLLLKIKPKTA